MATLDRNPRRGRERTIKQARRVAETGAGKAFDRLALVMPQASACDLEQDVRQDFPTDIYRFAQVPVSTWRWPCGASRYPPFRSATKASTFPIAVTTCEVILC